MSGYLKRKIDLYLSEWKTNPERKPLIIKGARQVGKTKSIKNFATNNYDSIVEINFAENLVYKQIVEDGYSVEFESIIGEALVKSGYELRYYKKKNSTLQEEFLVRYKDYLVPIKVKAGNNNSKSLSTLIKSDNYK